MYAILILARRGSYIAMRCVIPARPVDIGFFILLSRLRNLHAEMKEKYIRCRAIAHLQGNGRKTYFVKLCSRDFTKLQKSMGCLPRAQV